MKSTSNALWVNLFRQLAKYPDGYQWHHLKRQVIVNTVMKWNDLVEILQPHVDKTNMSYQEICEHFARATSES